MASLTDLETYLVSLDGSKGLKGTAFDLTKNVSLGVSSTDGSDFIIGIPWPVPWPTDVSKAPKTFTSTLASAFFKVLDEGLKASTVTTGNLFIDITTLNGDIPGFFGGETGSDTLINRFAGLINGLNDSKPNVTPIIRFLVGDPGNYPANDRWNKSDWWAGYRSKFESTFFGTSGLFKHPKAKLYVGFYSPNFDKTEQSKMTQADQISESNLDSLISIIRDMVTNIENALFADPDFGALIKFATQSKFTEALSGLSTPTVVSGLKTATQGTMSWNHSKILAVDGRTLMTGGANYAGDVYGNNKHDICDTQCTIKGDAALAAHLFCDELWSYLNKKHVTDTNSFLYTEDLKGNSPTWPTPDASTPLPLFKGLSRASSSATGPSVLTVARIGDWILNTELEYPVQFIDAMRDIIHNVMFRIMWKAQEGMVIKKGLFRTAVLPSTTDTQLLSSFQKAGVVPTAWSIRIAKCQAIRNAKTAVYIDAQLLSGSLQIKEDSWKKQVVDPANKQAGLTGTEVWDGVLWQYDLLLALATFMDSLATPVSQDHGVFILLTSTFAHNEYEDPVAANEFKQRIRYLVPKTTFDTASAFDEWFNARCHIRRTSATINDTSTPMPLWNHSKAVCCDQNLLFIGSDNPYASYNEEHGVWIDDKTAIGKWFNGLWTNKWNQSPVIDPATETTALAPTMT